MTPRTAGPLETALAAFPRVELTRAETPLQRLNHVSERLDLDVWMKRDDLTDLALGGDKGRQPEHRLARGVGQGSAPRCALGRPPRTVRPRGTARGRLQRPARSL